MKPVRVGVVSGDGLPISGLMTSLRNAIGLGWDLGLVAPTVHIDYGYAWRPDKPAYYPAGDPAMPGPAWLASSSMELAASEDLASWSEDLLSVRDQVADYATLGESQREWLRRRLDRLSVPYQDHFAAWLERNGIDWVIPMNMTLTDAPPVSWALHRATESYFSGRKGGGVLWWEHDLLGSCGIIEGGRRIYPAVPHALTPLPKPHAWTRWATVSDALTEEARGYGTGVTPVTLPNLLPSIPAGGLEARHRDWIDTHRVTGRPLLACPVRVFPVKGVEVSLRLLAGVKAAARRRGAPVPALVVFGALGEEPAYGVEMTSLARRLGLTDDVVWADGVPLTSHALPSGGWRMDEIDLLHMARATGGGVVFTPAVPDVETVGLGPALATVADIPCAVSYYDAYDGVYNSGPGWERFSSVLVSTTDPHEAGAEFLDAITAAAAGNAEWTHQLATNRDIVAREFPNEPWQHMWRSLAADCQ